MEQNPKIDNSFAARIVARLAADRKKTVVAIVLIALMIILWVRVLAKKGPASAAAATSSQQTAQTSQSGAKPATFVDLPIVPGRNDCLARDFFAADGFRHFGRFDGPGEVTPLSGDGEDFISTVVRRLRLDAIMMASPPQAFINDKLVSAGDKVTVFEGTRTFECEVISIDHNNVTVGCGQSQFKLKLSEATVSAD